MERMGLSTRAYNRIIKVALNITDMDHSEVIGSNRLAEAIQFRRLDREGWAG